MFGHHSWNLYCMENHRDSPRNVLSFQKIVTEHCYFCFQSNNTSITKVQKCFMYIDVSNKGLHLLHTLRFSELCQNPYVTKVAHTLLSESQLHHKLSLLSPPGRLDEILFKCAKHLNSTVGQSQENGHPNYVNGLVFTIHQLSNIHITSLLYV